MSAGAIQKIAATELSWRPRPKFPPIVSSTRSSSTCARDCACTTYLFRLLDAPAFRQFVHQSGAYLVLIASGAVYEEIIMDAPGLIDPDAYLPIDVEHKELSSTAWVRPVGRTASVSRSA